MPDSLVSDWTPNEADMHGMRSAVDGGFLFCGVSEQAFAIGNVTYQWPRGSKLTWSLDFSNMGQLNDMELKDCFSEALKEISACCDVRHEYVKNPLAANLRITRQRLDGRSGVLADCQIPFPGSSPDSTQLQMRLDDSEIWVISESPPPGSIDLYRTFLHEALHFQGLGHKPANIQGKALIAPTYDLTLRKLQPLDIDELLRRYGPPKTATAPPPPPPNSKTVYVTISQDEKVWGGPIPRIK